MESSEKPRKIVPPIWLLLFIAAMYLLDRFMPLLQFSGPFIWGFAASFMASGLAVIISSLNLFAKAGTGIVPFSETTAIVMSGPYKLTRNPMYLGMVLILIGVAFGFGSLTPFLIVPGFAWIIQTQFILAEEEFMEQAHGEAYLAYKKRVRRWV